MSFKYKIVCFCVHSVFYVLVLVYRQFYSFIRSFAPCMFVFVYERVFLCALRLRVLCVCAHVYMCVCALCFSLSAQAGQVFGLIRSSAANKTLPPTQSSV